MCHYTVHICIQLSYGSLGGGETQGVKFLLHTCEDLNLNPQYPCSKQQWQQKFQTWWLVPVILELWRWLEYPWLDSQSSQLMSSRVRMRSCLKIHGKEWQKKILSTSLWPAHIQTYTHGHGHPCVHACNTERKNKTENNKYHAVFHKVCEIDNTETQSSLTVTLSYSIMPYGMCKAKPWEAKRLARVPWLQASKGCLPDSKLILFTCLLLSLSDNCSNKWL